MASQHGGGERGERAQGRINHNTARGLDVFREDRRQTGSYLPLNSTAKPQSLDVVPSSFPNYHIGLDLLIQLTKHHAELGAQKLHRSLWHEPLKSPQASIFSGWKEVEIAPAGRPKDCRCHVLGRAGTA